MTTQIPDPANIGIDPATGLPLANPNAKMQEVTAPPPAPTAPPTPATPTNPTTPTTQPAPTDGSQPQNPVNPNPPMPGPTAPPTPAAPAMPQNNAQQYVVQPGDTLNTIAQRLGVSPTSITGFRSGNPNKIAVGEKLNVAASPAAPVTTTPTPLPQNNTAQTGETTQPTPTGKTPFQNVMDTYSQVYQELGLGTIKNRYTDVIKEQDKIQQELNDKINEVNSNPWLSSSSRNDQIDKLKEKYTPRLDLATHQAQLFDSLIKEGEQTAQFLVGHVETDTQKAIDTAQKKQEALDKLAEQDIHPDDVNGRAVLVDYKTKKIVADLGPSKSTSSLTGDYGDVKTQNALEQQYRAALERELSNRSGGLGLQDAKVNQAIHLKALFNQYKDANGNYNIPAVQYAEIAMGLASLVSGTGNVSDSAREAILQKTAKGDFNGALTYITGTPQTGSTQQVFKNLIDSIDRQGQTSQALRDQYVGFLHGLAPTGLDPNRISALEQNGLASYDNPPGAIGGSSNSKGKTSDLDFVEKSLTQNKLNYDQALKLVPAGKIGAIRNDTGALVSIDPTEFNSATYTKL